MKVLIYGNYLFSYEMQWGFQQTDWEVSVIAPQEAEHIKLILEHAEADLLITLGAPLELNLDVMKFMRDSRPSGMKHVHWDTDGISSTYYPSNSGDGIEMDVIYASEPDLVLTMCPEMQKIILQRGYDCEIMHYAFCPFTHHPMPEYQDKEQKFINLIGNAYVYSYNQNPNHYRYHSMKILLKPLLEEGFDVHVYGDYDYVTLVKELLGIAIPPERFHGRLPYENTCAAYNDSFMNIVTQNHDRTITKRTFEILGSGGFVLSADNTEIRKLFVPGRDLAVSASPKQTVEVVRYYLDNIEEWRKIRKNAALSVQNHTYKQRAEFIIEKLYKPPSSP